MRLILGFILVFQVALGAEFTYPDFKQCYAKNQNSFVYFGNLRAVAVGKYTAIAYSKTKPSVPFVKHDPFLNLYMFKSDKVLNPVRLKSTYSLKVGEWIAGMDEESLFVGNLAKNGDVLNSIYLQSATLSPNSIISCLCCDIYGLGTGKGEFIASEYIKRFINSKKVFYGDVGARFERKANSYFVSEIDPSFEKQQLHVGDEIVQVNGNKIYSLRGLNQAILFAKPKSKVSLHVKRAGKTFKLSIPVVNRMGGGAMQDSFLEKYGIFLDKKMSIVKIGENSFAQSSGLKIGDKLLAVNKEEIKSSSQLRKIISDNKGQKIQLLLDRKNFQFFVNMKL